MTRHTPWQKKIETLYKKHKEVYINNPPLSPFIKGGFAQSIVRLFYKRGICTEHYVSVFYIEGYIQSIVPLLYEVSESLNILPLFYKEGVGEITHYDL